MIEHFKEVHSFFLGEETKTVKKELYGKEIIEQKIKIKVFSEDTQKTVKKNVKIIFVDDVFEWVETFFEFENEKMLLEINKGEFYISDRAFYLNFIGMLDINERFKDSTSKTEFFDVLYQKGKLLKYNQKIPMFLESYVEASEKIVSEIETFIFKNEEDNETKFEDLENVEKLVIYRKNISEFNISTYWFYKKINSHATFAEKFSNKFPEIVFSTQIN